MICAERRFGDSLARLLVPILCLTVFANLGWADMKPNIVMILIDDMGWGDFSCFGNKDAKTPNIDRLAEEGIRFHQFYVSSPICSPSRCALMTGQYPQRWKITSYLNHRADNDRRGVAQWLSPSANTLARLLKERGYRTGHFGKWHLGGQRDVADAPAIEAYGFDESLTNFEGMGPKLLPLTQKPGESKTGRIWGDAERLGGPSVWMQRSEITRGYADAALAFANQSKQLKQPFYVNLWPDDVHSPFWPPVQAWGKGGRRELYLSVLQEMDRQMGRLFDHIRNDPALQDNTIILICSDNGPDKDAGSAGPFRGTKATLYEGGIRSPLIVWAPGMMAKEKQGSVNSQSYFSAMDLAPSLLAIVGDDRRMESTFDGEDFSEVILGRTEQKRGKPLFWRRPPDRKFAYGVGPLPDLAVREGTWKLLCDFEGENAELYDLDSDQEEMSNVANQHPEVTFTLTKQVKEWNGMMPQDNAIELGIEELREFQAKRK
jgi:arylsulfatase A-like enzyme